MATQMRCGTNAALIGVCGRNWNGLVTCVLQASLALALHYFRLTTGLVGAGEMLLVACGTEHLIGAVLSSPAALRRFYQF
jgi:hypothetical protein